MARVKPGLARGKEKPSPVETNATGGCVLDFNVRIHGKGIRLSPASVATIGALVLAAAVTAVQLSVGR
jgi:hypothetical protein